ALREASSLWRQLREERGIDGRDALWAHPDLLPTADDLTDPSAFLAGDPLAGFDVGDDVGEPRATGDERSDDNDA
ncbi:MAG: zinc-dependent metalloprotease, partial [Candidatus Nanopelagicales bacterium]